ncbi:MAG: MFS transporter [Myxococcales bacterium]|nr:MFS transporter [Myxococcales bacterium]
MERRRNPWWIPPFLGRVPAGLDDRSLQLLSAVALALLFEEYDLAMLTSTLKYISADLGMPEKEFGPYLIMIRAGALLAIFIIPLADRLGRRPLFIYSTAAMGVFTFATAFAQTPMQFVLLQAATRTFFLSGSAAAFVIITEEFPAEHRGWGMGMLAALGAVGHGVAAGAFALIDVLPYGWRALYAFGVIPLLLIPYFLSRVPETQRFKDHNVEPARFFGLGEVIGPLKALAVTHPARAAGIALSGFLVSAATLPSFQYIGHLVLKGRGWSPGEYSTMVIVGGAIGIIGNIVAGRLGDAYGRKIVGFTLFSLFPFAAWGVYQGSTAVISASWVGLVFCSMGGRVVLRALSTELFPTSHRGAASGMYSVLETLGGMTGLYILHRMGTDGVDEIADHTPLVASVIVLGAAVLLFFPETRRRELETIS